MSSKFDDVMKSCKDQMKKQGISCDESLLTAIAKALGPGIYNRDAWGVASSQKSELTTIKKSFIAGKLGIKDDDKADKAIEKAIGKSTRNKLRPVFYYLLVKELGKESVYK